jgi:hypothetical protein
MTEEWGLLIGVRKKLSECVKHKLGKGTWALTKELIRYYRAQDSYEGNCDKNKKR